MAYGPDSIHSNNPATHARLKIAQYRRGDVGFHAAFTAAAKARETETPYEVKSLGKILGPIVVDSVNRNVVDNELTVNGASPALDHRIKKAALGSGSYNIRWDVVLRRPLDEALLELGSEEALPIRGVVIANPLVDGYVSLPSPADLWPVDQNPTIH